MQRTGKVIARKEDEIEVSFQRPEACAHCGACAGPKEETRVTVRGDAPVGRWVDVEMPDGQVLKASFLAYVIPILLLLAGIALGGALFQSEAAQALCGIALMIGSWFVLRLLEKRIRKMPRWQPRILAVHEEGWAAAPDCGKRDLPSA